MPALLGDSHSYSSITFQTGLGFTGIAIALAGPQQSRWASPSPAVLWSFLDQSAQILDINNIPKEIVQITQGVVVLSVVIAYELVRRLALVRQQRASAGARTADRSAEVRKERRHDRRGHLARQAPRSATSDGPAAPPPGGRRRRGVRRPARSGLPRLIASAACSLLASSAWSRARTTSPRPARSAPPSAWPCPSHWRVWAGCGPSARAWSTSASRA